MTRHITPHKGDRTARAPGARIRPQTLQRIKATMQQRSKSFADLLEEQYTTGDDRMTGKIINTNFEETYNAVNALCKTVTDGNNGNETTLEDWMRAGNWQTMTIEDMAVEWDALTNE